MISIERLVTSREGFGITTASAAQRAACRIIDGRPLGDLRDDPDVAKLVGGPSALDRLPSERGQLPAEVCFLASIRSLKTITALATGIRASQTVDVSGLVAGEIPRVSIISLRLDTAAAAFSVLSATIRASSVLRSLLVGTPTADSLMLRHPSGRSVEIACVAGAKAGGGLVARWSAGLVADEAPRMAGVDDAVVNLDHARTSVLGRLLPGAQALYIGSPWAPFGPVYEMTTEHFGKPSEHMVVLRGTGPMLNPQWWTPERCEALRTRDPLAYQTDVLGEFCDPESSMFTSALLEGATRKEPAELEPNDLNKYVAAMDPATRGNSWTLVIATCTGAQGLVRKYSIVLARQWTGSRLAPLSPEAVLREIAELCGRYGISTVRTDQWAADALGDIARRFRLYLNEAHVTEQRKYELYESLRVRLESGELELPPVAAVREDLLRVRRRITQTGVSIVLPRTSDGRHADFAPSVALALADPPAPPKPPPLVLGSAEWAAEEQRLLKKAVQLRVSKSNRRAWSRDALGEMRRRIGVR